MALKVGDSLGRYRLEQSVGQGGMAVVYRAVDSVLGRTVAVKVIRPAFTEDPQFLERFLQEARVVATPVYMAPELARGGDATPSTDRYALAVMVYELIAGRPPFVGQNPLSVLHQQVHEPVPSIAATHPELPAGVDAFLARALAKD